MKRQIIEEHIDTMESIITDGKFLISSGGPDQHHTRAWHNRATSVVAAEYGNAVALKYHKLEDGVDFESVEGRLGLLKRCVKYLEGCGKTDEKPKIKKKSK